MMLRLFIALHFPETVKKQLGSLIADLRPRGPGIKWVEPRNIHLTLKFLGDTPQEKVPAIAETLGRTAKDFRAFTAGVRGCGGFPNLSRPRVIWVGLADAQPAIDMARAIDKDLARLGLEKERRPLSPHLTLGRIHRPGNFSPLAAYMQDLKFDAGEVILNTVALVKSTLTPQGPIYENLNLFTLEP